MKKVALVFVVAVLAPSLVLAWLAVHSLRDQQFLVERQQSLLDQRITDTLAQNISDFLARQQQDFTLEVEKMAEGGDARTLAAKFDEQLRTRWPLAEVGFCVTASGKILSPPPNSGPAAQMFRLDNSGFLGNREPVEVYLAANPSAPNAQGGYNSQIGYTRGQAGQSYLNAVNQLAADQPVGAATQSDPGSSPTLAQNTAPQSYSDNYKVGATGGGGGGGMNAEKNSYGSRAPRNESAPGAAPAGNPSGNSLGGVNSRFGGQPIAARNQNQISFAINNNANGSTGEQQSANLDGADYAKQLTRQTDNSRADSAAQAPTQAAAKKAPPVVASETDTLSAPSPSANRPIAEEKTVAQAAPSSESSAAKKDSSWQSPIQSLLNFKGQQTRKVSPQSKSFQALEGSKAASAKDESKENLSKTIPAEADFRQLMGDQTDGLFARFLQNKLKLMCWHRLSAEPDYIFGAQLNLDRVVDGIRSLVQSDDSAREEICVAVLDDNARPVVISRTGFQASWKRPFVATEVGDALPHWEVAVYLVNPAQLTRAAHTAKLTLGLLVAVLVVAIGMGGLLIVRSLDAELKLARQKTDFVSNVSHELKTPLTSIRMFSELLAEGRVLDQAKQHSYLHIISAEAGRLTRLINNVLDFSRMERGEKKYNFQQLDLTGIVRATSDTFRPHLEAGGFQFACELPATPIAVRGDSDALSQILVNLLSNAEKYAGAGREIVVQLAQKQSPLPHAEIRVLDRGPGVPTGSEEKIFEKFYRAHDSLSSGIQGSGLGLTIARQVARAHGGDVVYEPREGGGSCFICRIPLAVNAST